MRLEIIQNLIEAMDFTQFREFARQCIADRGYSIVLSDGWSDGGRDLRVHHPNGDESDRIAFQCSVQWKWKNKLFEDLRKAKKTYGADDFVYVTNRRIGDAVFEPEKRKARKDLGVRLSKIDKQDLAAQIQDFGIEDWFASIVGLQHNVVSNDVSLRTEVSDAFILFSDEADDFRDRIAEHAICVALLRKGEMQRDKLESSVAEILNLSLIHI